MRFVLALAAFLAVLPAAGASTLAAHLTVPSRSPVIVRGTGFHAGEGVAVTVSASATRRKAVTAGARGNLRAAFPGFSIRNCEPYVVRAKGSRGSSAVVRVIPDCAPPRPAG